MSQKNLTPGSTRQYQSYLFLCQISPSCSTSHLSNLLVKQRVLKEEARLITAHVVIALHATIENTFGIHAFARLARERFVDVRGVTPVLDRNKAELHFGVRCTTHSSLKFFGKRVVIEEHVWVTEVLVEFVLQIDDRLGDGVLLACVVIGVCF